MPRGGKRQGAGRKPLARKERWLGGNAGKRAGLLLVAPSVGGEANRDAVVGKPSVLTAGEATYWDLWAPVAHGRGMLHAGTVPGFVLLCQTAKRADALWACIEDRGYEQEKVTIDGAGQEHREFKANGLLSHWRGLMARVEQLQARYGLAADGKLPTGAALVDDEENTLAKLLAVK